METNTICPNCGKKYDAVPDFCQNCRYPFAGSDKEKSIFIGLQISKKGVITDTRKKVLIVRLILIVLGASSTLISLLQISLLNNYYHFYYVMPFINLSIGIMLIISGLLTIKAPILSTAIPLSIILILFTIILITFPQIMVRSVLWNTLLIAVLSYGLFSSIERKKLSKESMYLKEHKENEKNL